MTIDTILERKRSEAERRTIAASRVMDELRSYARSRQGRFIIFGSFVTGRMRYDSDLDVLIDFDPDERARAWTFVEATCKTFAIEPDIHDVAASRSTFVKRAVAEGLILE